MLCWALTVGFCNTIHLMMFTNAGKGQTTSTEMTPRVFTDSQILIASTNPQSVFDKCITSKKVDPQPRRVVIKQFGISLVIPEGYVITKSDKSQVLIEPAQGVINDECLLKARKTARDPGVVPRGYFVPDSGFSVTSLSGPKVDDYGPSVRVRESSSVSLFGKSIKLDGTSHGGESVSARHPLTGRLLSFSASYEGLERAISFFESVKVNQESK